MRSASLLPFLLSTHGGSGLNRLQVAVTPSHGNSFMLKHTLLTSLRVFAQLWT